MSAFSLPAGEFALAIRRASIATDRKASIPVLLCLKIDAGDHGVKIHGSNLFLHAAVVTPAVVTIQGNFAVDQAQLHGIVSRLPPDKLVKCSVAEAQGQLVLKCGGSKYQLALWDYSAFPAMAKPSKAPPVTLKSNELARLLAAAGVSMLLDDQRAHLSGIELSWGGDGVTAVATDSMRLSKITVPYAGASIGKVFLPYLGALAMQRFCDSLDAETEVSVLATGAYVHCWSAHAGLACKLVTESAVDYARVLAFARKGVAQATVSREQFIAAIARLRVASENAAVLVSWADGTDKVVLTVVTPTGDGREVLRGAVAGGATVLLSPVLLTDILASGDSDEVTLSSSGSDIPVLVADGDSTEQMGLVCVLMTCKIPGT